MKEIFKLTNKYIILATPLIIFSLISSIYLAVSANGALLNLLIGVLLSILMTSAFIAGWFNMIKVAVTNPDADNTTSLIKEFIPGVGEYFLSSLGALFNVILVTFVILFVITIVGLKFIGDPNISIESLNAALESAEALSMFKASLSPEQIVMINKWNLLLFVATIMTYLLELLYIPAIFLKEKNPFIAFFVSLKDLFSRKFPKTFGIYLLIIVVNLVITLLAVMLAGNVIIHFALTFANFYFLTLTSLGVSYYYYNNFVKPQLGQYVDTVL